MRKLVFALLFLAGCSEHVPVVTPVTVNVPVAVSCDAEALPEPDWNITHLGAAADDVDKLKAELADLDLSKGYIEELQAELEACL